MTGYVVFMCVNVRTFVQGQIYLLIYKDSPVGCLIKAWNAICVLVCQAAAHML